MMGTLTCLQLELLLLLRSRAMQVTMPLFLLVSIAASSTGIIDARQQQRTLDTLAAAQVHARQQAMDEANREDRGQLQLGQFRDPRDPANYVRIALAAPAALPPGPAFGIAATRASRLPFYFVLNTGPEAKTITSYEYINPELQRTGGFDVSFLTIYLLPLALIVLGHGIWTADKASGTDRLVTLGTRGAGAVYLRQLLLASVLPITFCMLAGWGIIAAAEGKATAKTSSALLFTVMVALYAAFWISVLALVIRRTAAPATSLAVLLSTFMLLNIAIPDAAVWMATSTHPQPSRADFLNASRQNSDRINREATHNGAAYLRVHPELKAGTGNMPAGAQAIVTATLVDAQNQLLTQSFSNNLGAQGVVIRRWSSISPALLAESEMDRLSGVDDGLHESFRARAKSYVDQLRMFFLPLLLQPGRFSVAQVQAMNSYPAFQETLPRTAAVTLVDLVRWMGLIGAVICALAFRRPRRLKPGAQP